MVRVQHEDCVSPVVGVLLLVVVTIVLILLILALFSLPHLCNPFPPRQFEIVTIHDYDEDRPILNYDSRVLLRYTGSEPIPNRPLSGRFFVDGVPLTFSFTLTDMAGGNVPFEGAAVYVWHCDAQGRYSMYTQGVEDETFLRGVQVADANGQVTFQTIVPGCYAGRWTHIHFEVYPDLTSVTDVSNAIATSQVAFPADMLAGVYALDQYSGSAKNLAGVGTSPADDMVFGEGDWSLELGTFTGDADSGYIGSLAVGVDTSTTPSLSGGGGQPPSGGQQRSS